MERVGHSGPSLAAPAARGGRYILIADAQAFRAAVLKQCARNAFPATRSVVCHSMAEAMLQLRARPAWLGIVALAPLEPEAAELVGRVVRERLATRLVAVVDRAGDGMGLPAGAAQLDGLFDCAAETPAMLTHALARVGEGERYRSASFGVSPRAAWRDEEGRPGGTSDGGGYPALLSETAWGAVGRSLKLSTRELQIVRDVFDNLTEAAIAAHLGIARRTVHTHLERVHAKLHIHHRAELIIRAVHEFLRLRRLAVG